MDGKYNLPVPQQCSYTPPFKACHSKNVWKQLPGSNGKYAQPEIKLLYDKRISVEIPRLQFWVLLISSVKRGFKTTSHVYTETL